MFSPMKSAIACFFGLVVAAAPASAFAHILLVSPESRSPGNDSIKVAPCGGAAWGANGSRTFQPGQQVTVKLLETIGHPGAYRVALDADGDDGFTPMVSEAEFADYKAYFQGSLAQAALPQEVVGPVQAGGMYTLLDHYGLHESAYCPSGLEDTIAGHTGCVWELPVTLPNITCEQCTLQVIQLMAEAGRTYGNGFYYHCADFSISGEPSGAAGASGAPGAGGASNVGGSGGEVTGGAGGQLASGGQGSGGESSGGQSAGPAGGTSAAAGGSLPTAPLGSSSKRDSGCSLSASASASGLPSLAFGMGLWLWLRRRRHTLR
jgi:hypothetical protein